MRHAHKLVIVCLLALSAALTGCETTTPTAQNSEASHALRPMPGGDNEPNTALLAMVNRIDMPLDVSLDKCWALVDEDAVPKLTRGLWEVNGMRIGLLHAKDAADFANALPTITGESLAKLYTSHYPTAVRSTPRVQDTVNVDLTVPPKSPTLYRAHGGQLQLLVRIGQADNGQVFIEVTPHHYVPKPDLVPRNPLEKQLDGRVFDELAALLPVDPDTAIVIGLYRPWPQPEATTDSTEPTENPETPDTTETPTPKTEPTPPDQPAPVAQSPDTPPDEASPQPSDLSPQQSPPPPVPEGLGRALMTGSRAGHPIQIMMVLSMLEEDQSNNKSPKQ